MRFVELNGDGRVDLVYHRGTGSSAQKGAYLNTGDGVAVGVGVYAAPVYRGQHGVGFLGHGLWI